MLASFLRKLIAIRSYSRDVTANARLLDVVEKELKPYLSVKRFSSNGHPSLVATTRNIKTPRLLLMAHTDVVPGADALFRLQKRGNKFEGRGVIDMKFAIACYVKLAKELGKNIRAYNFAILLTSDEEIGGFDGTEQFLKKGYKPEFVFLPDGGMNWQVVRGSKGIWHLDFEAKGKSAHAAYPWHGKSPIMTFFQFLQELQKEFHNSQCDNKNHYHNTLTISRISGGEAINQVPGQVSASVDIRHVPETTKKDLEKRIHRIMKKYKGITLIERAHGHAHTLDLNHPYMQEYMRIAKAENVKISDTFAHGTSDARFFAEQGIQVLTVSPRGGGHHSDGEWMDTRDFEKYYSILKEWVERITKK